MQCGEIAKQLQQWIDQRAEAEPMNDWAHAENAPWVVMLDSTPAQHQRGYSVQGLFITTKT